jgi:F0F1-type ATP synthase membrane subunit b/b'
MPTVAELERLQALISRLTPLSQRQRGELIQSQDWNTLVGTVIEVARAALAESAHEAVPPHEHPDQVKLAWLDPRLRTLIERGPLSDPSATAKLSELDRRINRVPTQLSDVQNTLQDFRDQVNAVVSRDLQRESDLTVVRRRVEGLPNTQDDILTLRQDLSGIRTNVQRVLDLSDSLTVNGQPVDFSALTNRLNSLESLREQLRTPSGEFLDATRLEQRLTELTNTLVTEAELDAALNSRPGRISDAQIADLRAQLSGSLSNDLRVSTGQLRQELQAEVANRLAQVDGLVSQAIASSLPNISESVLGGIRAEINTNLQTQLESFQTTLNQRFTEVEGRLTQTFGQQADVLVASALDRQLPDRLGQLQSSLAGLSQQFTQLQTQLGEQTTRLNGFDTRLGQVDTRLAGLDNRVETGFRNEAAARGALRDTVLQEIDRRNGDLMTGIDSRFEQLTEQTKQQIGEAISPLREELRSELGSIARESAIVESRAAINEFRGELRGVVQDELTALTPQLQESFVSRDDFNRLSQQIDTNLATKSELVSQQTQISQTTVSQADFQRFQTQVSDTFATRTEVATLQRNSVSREEFATVQTQLRDNVATKADLVNLREEMRRDTPLRSDLTDLQNELGQTLATKAELGALRNDLQQTTATKTELGALQNEFRQTFVTRSDLATFQTQVSQNLTSQVNQLINTRIPVVVNREVQRSAGSLTDMVDRAVTQRMGGQP